MSQYLPDYLRSSIPPGPSAFWIPGASEARDPIAAGAYAAMGQLVGGQSPLVAKLGAQAAAARAAERKAVADRTRTRGENLADIVGRIWGQPSQTPPVAAPVRDKTPMYVALGIGGLALVYLLTR